MRSWFKWGLPLASVVLLGAAGGGVLLAENVYPRTLSQQNSQGSQLADSVKSPIGIVYTPDAAASPDLTGVQSLLDLHFSSINERNYDRWKSTVVPEKWRELPKDKWFDSYDTTHDFGWTVHRIDQGADGSLLVMLTFMSTQGLEDAPPQLKATCVAWNVVYPLVLDDAGRSFRLDTSKLPNSALLDYCNQ
ncbi:hypothetical protein ACWDKQ_17215 [Saccharopolyspora sp. NPDC000995]